VSVRILSGVVRRTKEVVDKHDPRHSLLSVDIVKHLGRVLESHRSLAERVADSEKVDKAGVVSTVRGM
jgi:hypothetical protein